MDCTGKLYSVSRDWKSGKIILSFLLNEEPTEEISLISCFEKLAIKVKKFRKKRSSDANAYMWVLITEIANHPDIRSTKEEIYEQMLQKQPRIYEDDKGHVLITVRADVDMARVDGHWIFYKGNGKFSSYFKLKGTSEYDSSEMAQFVDMVVQEAKGLGIETLPPKELERLKETWGKVNQSS